MITIYKYPAPIQATFTLLLYDGYIKFLTVQLQKEEPFIWVKVDTSKQRREFEIYVFGTGNPIPADENFHYIGTIQKYNGVWHYFYKTWLTK